ncbi:MAG: FAD:protein FMN transferase, partial [Propionibacteriaceae bacterium]|nr:FAD:protein FMN transferase [Propionibacteriaceae bacterium]
MELRIDAPAAAAEAADRAAVVEFERLDAVFSTFRDDSLLSRWRRGETIPRSAEFIEVLAAAQRWYETSEGAFHPAADALRQRWLAARDSGAEPSPEELSELAATTRDLPFLRRGWPGQQHSTERTCGNAVRLRCVARARRRDGRIASVHHYGLWLGRTWTAIGTVPYSVRAGSVGAELHAGEVLRLFDLGLGGVARG